MVVNLELSHAFTVVIIGEVAAEGVDSCLPASVTFSSLGPQENALVPHRELPARTQQVPNMIARNLCLLIHRNEPRLRGLGRLRVQRDFDITTGRRGELKLLPTYLLTGCESRLIIVCGLKQLLLAEAHLLIDR